MNSGPTRLKIAAQNSDLRVVLPHFAWIFGLLSTSRYATQPWKKRFGPGTLAAHEGTRSQLEHSLFEDRLAVILFFLGTVILVYTFLHAPGE
jgi:hypothetical protein